MRTILEDKQYTDGSARTTRPGNRARERLRVFMGPTEIAGYYHVLRDGLAELGVAATLYTHGDHPFQSAGGASRRWPLPVRWVRRARARYLSASLSGSATRKVWMALSVVLEPLVFAWAALRFNAFIFGFGSTITMFPAVELRILRMLRRKVIFVFHGSDSRPPYMDGTLMGRGSGRTPRECARLAAKSKARAMRADRYADYCVENPASAHFHERPCVNGFVVGLPLRPRERAESAPPELSPARPVRILHSPSHPEGKGTPQIQAAIDALRGRGHDIDFILITGRPNAEVLEELARCDFVVDQVFTDTPMAGFAAEAASFGKPAVVAGYAGPVFDEYIAPEHRAPTLYCRPEEIEAAIERMVVDRAYRTELGRRARRFVRDRFAARAVAERFVSMLEDSVPVEWLFDPRHIRYLHGWGMTEELARETVRAVIDQAGTRALQLSDKPALESLLVEFARGGTPEAPARGAAAGVQRSRAAG